uniref:Maelstrom domain-containing protein n=1 Tax=Heliothis virescens TaxID=7102 RepID=A0A2A4J3Q4_HELVI
MECTNSRTQRWAYTVMDSCCPVVGIEIKPGQHVPKEYDVDGVLKYRDTKKVWSGPTVAGFGGGTSSCNTTVNESFEASHNSTASSLSDFVRKEKRSHTPMRLPELDYTRGMRRAPELTEEDFPALTGGHGRGRGLAGSFGKMNIRK